MARWSEIDSGASQPTTVTTESSRENPRSTCSGSHGLPSSSSAMQKPSLPGWPSVDRSSRPGAPPPVSVTTSLSARPIVRFARQPGPSTPIPLCTPIASRTGPLTITSWPAGWVVTACPSRLKAGSSAASTAASTTGKYSGRQPARTAHAATRSSVASPIPGGTSPSDRVRVAAAEHRVDARARGGDDREPVGPPAREHVLHLVGGAGALDERQHLLVVRRLGRAAGLRARRLAGDLRSRRAGRARRLGRRAPTARRRPIRPRSRRPTRRGRAGTSSAGSRGRTRATCRTAPAPPARCP